MTCGLHPRYHLYVGLARRLVDEGDDEGLIQALRELQGSIPLSALRQSSPAGIEGRSSFCGANCALFPKSITARSESKGIA